MKKLLAVLLAAMVLCGVLAVGASAMTMEEYEAAEETVNLAYAAWFSASGFNEKYGAATDAQRESLMALLSATVSPLWDAMVDALAAEPTDYDAVLAARKAFLAQGILVRSTFFNLYVSDSLWDLLGGNPSKITYILTYNLQDGTGGPAQQTDIAENTTTTLGTTVPTKEGYIFKGWSATPDGATSITSIVMDDNKTVYAILEPVSVPDPDPDPDADPDPDPDPIFVFLVSFLPEGIANVAAVIVRYVFFGWLWGRWL